MVSGQVTSFRGHIVAQDLEDVLIKWCVDPMSWNVPESGLSRCQRMNIVPWLPGNWQVIADHLEPIR
jgi:hypothetical protein